MTVEEVEALERGRVEAMITCDLEAFEKMLSDDMRWSHAAGNIDTKQSMIAQYAEGGIRCFAVERSETETRIFGTAAIVTGVVHMDVEAAGVRKKIRSRYTGVWSEHDGNPQLVSWQSARWD